MPNVATPITSPSWLTVTITPVASAASAPGTRISTAVISGLNAAAIAPPSRASARYSAAPPLPPPSRMRASVSRATVMPAKPQMASQGRARAGSRCQFRLTAAKVAADGANVGPARSGESPRPPWRCRARAKKNPPNTVMTANSAAIPSPAPGSLRTRPGTSGEPPRAASRPSMRAKPANRTALPASQAQPQTGQCSGWPRTSGTTRASTAGERVSRPGRSRPRAAARVPAGSFRHPAASSTAPIGTLTRNTGRHVAPNRSALISRPPAICPTITPPASTAA